MVFTGARNEFYLVVFMEAPQPGKREKTAIYAPSQGETGAKQALSVMRNARRWAVILGIGSRHGMRRKTLTLTQATCSVLKLAGDAVAREHGVRRYPMTCVS